MLRALWPIRHFRWCSSNKVKVSLSVAEQKLATFVGKRRFLMARQQGLHNRKMNPRTQEETEVNGMAAEIALCKILNVYPDLGDQHQVADMEFCGYTIDVKQTHYENGRLLLEYAKKSYCDIYVLMVGDMPHFRCAGLAHINKLKQESNLIDLGYGKTYGLDQGNLTDINHFLQVAGVGRDG